SLSVDAARGGSAGLYHVVTLGFHVAASVMTTVAAEALGLTPEAWLIAGLLFATHPVTSLVAGAIAFRSEAMIAVALLSLVYFHTHRKAVPAALAIFLGGLCKETVLGLSPLFVLAFELRSAKGSRADRRKMLVAEALG